MNLYDNAANSRIVGAMRIRGPGGGGGLPIHIFWQIRSPYSNRDGGANYTHKVLLAIPPIFSDLLTDVNSIS